MKGRVGCVCVCVCVCLVCVCVCVCVCACVCVCLMGARREKQHNLEAALLFAPVILANIDVRRNIVDRTGALGELLGDSGLLCASGMKSNRKLLFSSDQRIPSS
jgi:hypothetical protein